MGEWHPAWEPEDCTALEKVVARAGSLAPCNRIPRKKEARKALSAVVFIKATLKHPAAAEAPQGPATAGCLRPPGEETRKAAWTPSPERALDSLPDNKCFQVPGEHSAGHSCI